ncbi:MAG: serine/threonine protein kinase [Archangium sp.]|nr:serine/threonine protein kinase [Archangium sp.]
MQVDSLVDGRFLVLSKVAAGGMGTVFRALDNQSGKAVALKALALSDDTESMGRFQREADRLREISHPNIVRYVAHGAYDGGLYLAMAFVEGVPLSRRVRREGLTIDETVRVGVQVASALGALHRAGLVHRDVKPSNVMVPSIAVEPAILVDFGLVKPSVDDEHLTRTGFALGSMGYMSPEQARRERNLSPAADVYALGCVLYVCLTGRKLVPGVDVAIEGATALPVSDINGEVPKALSDVVAAMMEPAPSARPQTGGECEALLRGIGVVGTSQRRPLGGSSGVSVAAVRARTFVVAVACGPREGMPGDGELQAMHQLASQFDASAAALRDGVWTFSAKPTTSSVECASTACRLALEVLGRYPGAPVVAALGGSGVDDVFDRALATLADERQYREGAVRFDDESSRRAAVDAVTRQLGDRYYLVSLVAAKP